PYAQSDLWTVQEKEWGRTMADHDESNLPEDSDTAATPSTEPQPASSESQNVEQQAAPQEEALDESDAADQPESSTEDVVADGSSLSEQEEADADTADNSEDDEEPDVSPGDYVVMDPIPDLIKLPLPEDPEIIEPHQPPALGGDGPESSEPVVFD